MTADHRVTIVHDFTQNATRALSLESTNMASPTPARNAVVMMDAELPVPSSSRALIRYIAPRRAPQVDVKGDTERIKALTKAMIECMAAVGSADGEPGRAVFYEASVGLWCSDAGG